MVTDLGQGESEAIGLAFEHPGSRLIMDDLLGRRIAKMNNLQVTGTLGVLLKAKKEGFIQQLKPVVYELEEKGMWLDSQLIALLLEAANES